VSAGGWDVVATDDCLAARVAIARRCVARARARTRVRAAQAQGQRLFFEDPPPPAQQTHPPAPPKSPQNQTTTAIKCADTLNVLGKLVYNTAVAPKDPKFRRVKLGNAKIAATVGAQPGALQALELLGWRPAGAAEGQQAADLELPEATTLTMAQHRLVLAAQDALASASLRRAYAPSGNGAGGGASAHSSAGNLVALQQQPQPQPQPQ
jgi:hypothetical protein